MLLTVLADTDHSPQEIHLFGAGSTYTAMQHGLPTTEPPLLSSCSSLGVAFTPVLYQMSAKQPLGDHSYMPAPQLKSCLKKDLKGHVLTTLPNFFLHELWPNSALPCHPNMNIFHVEVPFITP